MKVNAKVKASNTGLSYKSVLIIDDNELDLFITERLLRNGARVGSLHAVQDPLNALTSLKSVKSSVEMPDLIILDLKMPGFDGFAFLKGLSEFQKDLVRTCRVMVLSAYFELEPELVEKTKDYPFVTRYLKKPLDVMDLLKHATQ